MEAEAQICSTVIGEASVTRLLRFHIVLGHMGGKATANFRTPAERQEFAKRAGLIGGPARAKKLSAKRRREIARKAAQARWEKSQR